MDYNIKFPIEHFDEIWADAGIRYAVSELAKNTNINTLQPALFSDYEWRLVLSDYVEPESTNLYKTISTLTSWGFTKAIYKCPKEFIQALVVSDYGEIDNEIERLFRFSGCAYFEGEWAWWFELQVQGWWMTVVNYGDGTGCLRVVLNTLDGLVLYDVLLDERGLADCLIDSVSGIREYLDDPTTATEETNEARVVYSGLANAVRIAFYLLSDNAEIETLHTLQTRQYEAGGISVPGEISVFEVGKDAAKRVKQAETEGVVKPAHWYIEPDGTVNWLCGHESHSDNILEEFDEADPWTDEELVEVNKGLHENEFSVPLPDDYNKDAEFDEAAFIKARTEGVEKVHEARARVYAAEGRLYDRSVQEGELWETQEPVTDKLKPRSEIHSKKVH